MPKDNREVGRLRVIELHGQGLSTREIARTVHKSQRYVLDWIHHYQTHGHVRDLPRTGRPKKVTHNLVRTIDKKMRHKQCQSVRKTTRQLRAAGVDISNTSVWRGARSAGMRPFIRKKKPLLTPRHKSLRLEFARKYKYRNWAKHLFADEKTFYLYSLTNRKNDVIWASREDTIEPKGTVKGAPKIQVYGAFSKEGKTSLHFFKENLTGRLYCNILDTVLPNTTNRLYGNTTWKYVHDNDPKHKSGIAQNHIRTRYPKCFQLPDFPPQSPDLNPIENVWATIGGNVALKNPQSLASMKKMIKSEWNRVLTADVRKTLIKSIPDRLKEVIRNRGGNTRY